MNVPVTKITQREWHMALCSHRCCLTFTVEMQMPEDQNHAILDQHRHRKLLRQHSSWHSAVTGTSRRGVGMVHLMKGCHQRGQNPSSIRTGSLLEEKINISDRLWKRTGPTSNSPLTSR